jgi:hypothetical protein
MSKFAGLAVKADQASRMTIHHPATGLPLRDAAGEAAWIDLLSMDGKAAQQIQRAAQNRRLERRVRKLTAEDLAAEEIDLLAALTAKWRLLTLDGAPLEVDCTASNAAELYALPELAWLREQVSGFVADRGNFLRT